MKITKYFMMLAAAAGLAAACQPDEIVTFNPEDVTAPVLHAVSDIEITVDNKDTGAAEFTWNAADFGVKSQVYYSLNMSANDVTVSLFSGVSGSSYSVSYDALNNKAFNDLGIASGEAGEVTFTLGASLAAGATYWSEPVSAKVTPTSAEKVYPKLWVVGSYNGWAHDASNQFLYNFAEDDVTYQGVIDFGEDHSANEFKITGGAWGTDEHSATGAQTEEGSSVALVAGGGDNITAWKAKRYYHLTFNRTALTISKDLSFDQVGIIGLNGDWENDIVMTFHAAKQRFYADIDVASDTEMKFRMDGGWDVNYGGDVKALSSGGDNIKVSAGKYRVYFNLNNLSAITCTFDEKAYGTEESAGTTEPDVPVEPTPSTSGWALIGDFNGWGGDLAMTQNGVIWSVANVELKAGQGFKLRKDAGWDVNRGATGDVEPFEVTVGEAIEVVNNGKNLTVPADGAYDIYYDEGNEKVYVLATGSAVPEFDPTWFVVGNFNGWTVGDVAYKMSKKGDWYVFEGFVSDGQGFKLNAGSWDNNRGATGDVEPYAVTLGAAVEVVHNGKNLSVAEGTYDIYMNAATDKMFVVTPGETPVE